MDQNNSTNHYDQGVAVSIIVLNVISMASLCFVLGVYLINWKTISSFPMRLSFYLCLSCLFKSITVIILNPITIHQIQTTERDQASSFCVFQGVLKVTFDLSSIIWTTMITFSVYASVVLKRSLDNLEIPYLLIAFLLPLIAACIPIFFDAYQFDDYSCWFATDQSKLGFWLRMGYFFIPLWILFFVNLFLSVMTYRSFKKMQMHRENLRSFKKLMLFPFILFITGAFATASTLDTYISQRYLLWLNGIGLCLLNLYGFFSSIAYGFNPIIRSRIRLCLMKADHTSFSESSSNAPEFRMSRYSKNSRNSEQIEDLIKQMSYLKKASPQNQTPHDNL